jgi:formylglycine-generating enzyme required for sulfatase activity
MKRFFFITIILVACSAALNAQNKVAILETVDKENKVPYGVKLQLRSSLTYAISSTPGYEGYDRVDMSSIMGEHNFQRTGMVSDAQIRKLGEMTGCSSILVAEAAIYDATHIIVTAKILNVESAGVESSASPAVAGTDPEAMQNACNKLAGELLGSGVSLNASVSDSRPRTQRGNVITISVAGVSFDMVKVEAGSFVMGCTSEQGDDCDDNEFPYHRVTISRDYYIGVFEVTQELWEAVMGYNPSSFRGFDKPVENVNWNDCHEFCEELSRMTGRRFRLPTEAEWEYAARGGKKSTSAKWSGSSSAPKVAWEWNNSNDQTHPVGRLYPNELGIYDMCGNVWEWCEDKYSDYSSSSAIDPIESYSGYYRVLRGGSWYNSPWMCRVTARGYATPYKHRTEKGYGFRIVLQ